MQHTGAITGYIDVAQLTLYAFWIFFFGLIYYLRREDKREGYPLVSEDGSGARTEGFPPVPSPKTFIMADGSRITVPRAEPEVVLKATRVANFPGAAWEPTGNPMIDGLGPAAWSNRADHPDLAWDDHKPKLVPLRAAGDFFLALEDADPRGMDVVAGDGKVAGKVVDVWVDRAEVIVRYLEAEIPLAAGARRVLIPLPFADIQGKKRRVVVGYITSAQFAAVPGLKNPDQVTSLEEDKISAYFGGGQLYSTPESLGPVI